MEQSIACLIWISGSEAKPKLLRGNPLRHDAPIVSLGASIQLCRVSLITRWHAAFVLCNAPECELRRALRTGCSGGDL